MNAAEPEASSTLQAATATPGLSFWQIWNMSFGFMGIQLVGDFRWPT